RIPIPAPEGFRDLQAAEELRPGQGCGQVFPVTDTGVLYPLLVGLVPDLESVWAGDRAAHEPTHLAMESRRRPQIGEAADLAPDLGLALRQLLLYPTLE